MSIIDREKYNYDRVKVQDKEGKTRYSYSKGDAVARAMLGMDHEDLVKIVKGNKVLDERIGRHADKPANSGQFRMMVGNSIRALVKRGTPVKVGKHTISDLNQDVPIPEVKETPKAAKPKSAAKRATKKAS